MLQGIHHTAIICSNYEVSKKFYSEILGFKILAENYRSERNSYKLDLCLPNGNQIELFSFPDPPERISHPEACGLRHIAFSTESVESFVEHIESFDIEAEPIRIDEYTGKKYTFFKDPDGLPLELYENSS